MSFSLFPGWRGRMRRFRSSLRRRGQTLVEYAIIICVISIVAVAVLIAFGQQTKNLYSTIVSHVESAPGGAGT